MDRIPLLVANWKMALSHKAALETVKSIKKLYKDIEGSIITVICPSFTSLSDVASHLAKQPDLEVGAQNVHWEEVGAWTGEVAVSQLTPFVTHCIIGHSERRQLTGETDEQVAAKAALLVRHGITPIVCVGESLAQHQAGETVARVTNQVKVLLAGLTRVAMSRVVIAYEPIWAISSNNPEAPPDPAEVGQNMMLIRTLVAKHFDGDAAERLRVLYGGSVDSKNIQAYVSEPGVDGALVGKASLKPMELLAMAKLIAHKDQA